MTISLQKWSSGLQLRSAFSKNQENGAGKQWSLHQLPLKTEVEIFRGVRTPLVPLTSYAPVVALIRFLSPSNGKLEVHFLEITLKSTFYLSCCMTKLKPLLLLTFCSGNALFLWEEVEHWPGSTQTSESWKILLMLVGCFWSVKIISEEKLRLFVKIDGLVRELEGTYWSASVCLVKFFKLEALKTTIEKKSQSRIWPCDVEGLAEILYHP